MSRIELIHGSCADQNVDVIVNAANRNLREGGGICGVIFSKAGPKELARACRGYNTPLKDGDAVITAAFNISNARAVIHAVGPDFSMTPRAFEELYLAYYNSLLVLKENDYHSIAFPLISSGIFAGGLKNAVEVSVKQCIRAYRKFVKDNPDYDINVKICAFSESEMDKANAVFKDFSEQSKNDGKTGA
ncbi:MAG: macro domain-containing protein [Lachnospiraceae bacterium]|nr:macro domain-containing protein [Lachnospiraceae bacterium]